MKLGIILGIVSIENFRGRLRLRWRHEGKRYNLSLGLDTSKDNSKLVRKIAAQIELDIMESQFDPTLERYGKKSAMTPAKPTTLLALWDEWVQTLGLSERTKNGHYNTIRKKIVAAAPKILVPFIATDKTSQKLTRRPVPCSISVE